MKNAPILIAAIISTISISCKKNNTDPQPTPPATTPSEFMPGTAGSYWVYQEFLVDSNGVETSTGTTDSIYTTDTKTIRNKTWVGYGSKMPYFEGYYTDSSGFRINESGFIQFSSSDNAVLLFDINLPPQSWYDFNKVKSNQRSGLVSVTTPAGTFSTKFVDNETTIQITGEKAPRNMVHSRAFAKSIGLVMYEIGYISGMDLKQKNRFKLVRYHIAK